MSVLLNRLQEERGAVAFNIFLDRLGGEVRFKQMKKFKYFSLHQLISNLIMIILKLILQRNLNYV